MKFTYFLFWIIIFTLYIIALTEQLESIQCEVINSKFDKDDALEISIHIENFVIKLINVYKLHDGGVKDFQI